MTMKPQTGNQCLKRKAVPMLVVNGLGFPFYFDVDKIKETINFQAKANDIFIVSCTAVHCLIVSRHEPGKEIAVSLSLKLHPKNVAFAFLFLPENNDYTIS